MHEQIAAYDLAGSLAEQEPALVPDIMFGAASSLAMDAAVAEHVLSAWEDGRSSLRRPLTGDTVLTPSTSCRFGGTTTAACTS